MQTVWHRPDFFDCSNIRKTDRNDFQRGRGISYIISSLGVTGIRKEITTDVSAIIKTVRENTQIPCAVGFGISTPQQAKKMAELSDGVIVGSAIVKLLEKYGREAATILVPMFTILRKKYHHK